MKMLYLLRHAKSSWENPGLADRERPLAPRGRKAARAIGRHLACVDARPELVLCSPALRAIQTLERLLAGFAGGVAPAIEVRDALYPGCREALLKTVRALPVSAERVLLISHDPGLHALAVLLAAEGEPARLAALRAKFPTAALAVLTLGDWVEAGAGTARLEEFVRPRGEEFVRPRDLS